MEALLRSQNRREVRLPFPANVLVSSPWPNSTT
jgi:hypothetical protein